MLRPSACLALAASLTLGATSALAAGPTVASFLARANPIRDQGVLGMLSPDVPQLRAEAKEAIRQMKAESAARVRGGKPAIYCKSADEPDPAVEDVVDALNDIPTRQQRVLSLKDGIARAMARFYPCR